MTDANTANNQHSQHGPYTQRVMKLVGIMKTLVAKGKQSGVTKEDLAPLAELVAVADFERVGPFHDAKTWPEYVELIAQWVNHSEGWDPVVKRITEVPGLVYMQCEEMITNGDTVTPFYSLSLYEFNDANKICRIEVYMQQEMPAA